MRPAARHPIYLYDQPVDMRKSFEGLSGLVEQSFPGHLLTGALFLFLNRCRDRIKILSWEDDGFAIWYKRLERGTFSNCFHGQSTLTRQQFILLLEGIVPKRINQRFSL
ncbi:MAG: IS66 family insertion sequence element accessory protein TnpB [Oscillospiraceae bacterium]|nr:IS66 family insertion sequence element accessory protein TnpB [Oscillospiraceae bacterium]